MSSNSHERVAHRLSSPALEQLPDYQAGRSIEEVRRELRLAEVIKLASNEHPFGPSPRAIEAMARILGELHRYPDDGTVLCEELAALHHVAPTQIVLGAGATDLIELCVRAFCTPSEHALVSAGSFLAYRIFLIAAQVPYSEVSLAPDASIDLEALAGAVRAETKLIFLPNPNNPTGSCFGQAAFERFLGQIPADLVLVLDDAYVDFNDAADAPDTLAALRARPRTVVLRSFSKSHGLAGLRVGYSIAAQEPSACLRRLHRPFAVSRVALAGARAALHDTDHVQRTIAHTRAERAWLTGALRGLGLVVLPSQTNFVTLDLGASARVDALVAALLRKGIIVRPLGAFGLPGHLRITVGNERENRALVAALRNESSDGVDSTAPLAASQGL